MPLPLFEQEAAKGLKVVRGNASDSIAHTTGTGVLPTIMGTDNKIFVDDPSRMSEPILAHEVMHKIQQKAGNFKDTGDSNYNYGGMAGLKATPSISTLNPEQQANIPQDYMSQMNAWSKGKVTPQILRQADQLNSAYARPMSQLANMASDSINTTPAAPGPPPAALTGMIKPLPEIGGNSLYRSKVMPAYQTSPFGPAPVLMVGGRTEYLYGIQSDAVGPTQIAISSVAITANVATVVGTIVSGNAPVVGSLVSIRGTQTSSGLFNVTNVALASVTPVLQTGAVTITFPLTNANIGTTPDHGFAAVPTTTSYDTMANGSSMQAASAENDPSTSDERAYFAQVFFGTIPTTATVTLQTSLVDQDSQYQTIATVASVSGGTVTTNASVYANANFKFLRFNIAGLTGSGTIAAAIVG